MSISGRRRGAPSETPPRACSPCAASPARSCAPAGPRGSTSSSRPLKNWLVTTLPLLVHDLDVVQLGVPMHHAGRNADGEGGEEDHEGGEDDCEGGVDNCREDLEEDKDEGRPALTKVAIGPWKESLILFGRSGSKTRPLRRCYRLLCGGVGSNTKRTPDIEGRQLS